MTEVNYHTLKVTVVDEFIQTKFTCIAPEGAPCRLVCTDYDCEMWETDGSHRHPLKDNGKCNAMESFENFDWLEVHEPTGHVSVLYDGPVNAFWDGEDFQWRIDAPSEDKAQSHFTDDLARVTQERDEAQRHANNLGDLLAKVEARVERAKTYLVDRRLLGNLSIEGTVGGGLAILNGEES